MGNLKVLELQKTGYDAGLLHGKSLKEEIAFLIKSFQDVVLVALRQEVSLDVIRMKALEFDSHIPKKYSDEMKGIANGAGVDYNDILLINTFEDILNVFSCSSIVTLKQNISKPLIHGRNLDYNVRQVVKMPIIFDYQQGFTLVGIPGYIGGVSSTNENGLTLSYNFAPGIDNPRIGMPSGLMCRKIIEEAKTLSDAQLIIESTNKTVCNLITISSINENIAKTFEVSLDAVAARESENGFLCTTNHFIVHSRADESIKISESMNSTSQKRHFSLQDFIKNKQHADVDEIKEALYLVKQGLDNIAGATVQSIIFLPEEQKLYLANDITIPVNETNNYIEYKYGKVSTTTNKN